MFCPSNGRRIGFEVFDANAVEPHLTALFGQLPVLAQDDVEKFTPLHESKRFASAKLHNAVSTYERSRKQIVAQRENGILNIGLRYSHLRLLLGINDWLIVVGLQGNCPQGKQKEADSFHGDGCFSATKIHLFYETAKKDFRI